MTCPPSCNGSRGEAAAKILTPGAAISGYALRNNDIIQHNAMHI